MPTPKFITLKRENGESHLPISRIVSVSFNRYDNNTKTEIAIAVDGRGTVYRQANLTTDEINHFKDLLGI